MSVKGDLVRLQVYCGKLRPIVLSESIDKVMEKILKVAGENMIAIYDLYKALLFKREPSLGEHII